MSEDLLKQAHTALRAGLKDQAASLLVSYLKDNPDDDQGWLLLSRVVLIPVIAGIAYEYIKFTSARMGS